MIRSDLPFGSEFSPQQIDLSILLEIAYRHGKDWKGFETEVRERYFSDYKTTDYNKSKLANNTKLSMRAYGLIEGDDIQLTEFGLVLYELRNDLPSLTETFAQHILKNCQGMNFVQCILDMQSAGEEITLNTLRQWLVERGLVVPRGGKHMSTLRLWLEQAGVFISGYRVDESRLNALLGLAIEAFEALAGLTPEQRAFLKTLTNMGGSGPHLSNDIEKLATATYGVRYNEKNLPKQVLYPLAGAGYITLERGTKGAGRGAKPFQVSIADRLITGVITPLLEQLDQQVHADLRPFLRKR